MMNRAWCVVVLAMAAGCGGDDGETTDDGVSIDAPSIDGAMIDAPMIDAPMIDAPSVDAPPDAMHEDLTVTQTMVGAPTWKPQNPFLWSTTVGTIANGFTPAQTELVKITPHHVFDTTNNLFKSGEPHQPPYATEMIDALPTSGFKTGNEFALADWSNSKGIGLSFVVEPTALAPTGDTFDGTLPMIQNSLFPINNDAELRRDNVVVDPDFDSNTPSAQVVAGKAGYSHMTYYFFETTEYLAAGVRTGSYTWVVHLRDTTGAGWDITVGPMYVE